MHPLTCPACGHTDRPLERIFGFPTPDARAAVARGDAEIAGGCTDVDGWQAPARCRHCRRVVLPPDLDDEDLATYAAQDLCDPVAPGLWCGRERGALVLVALARGPVADVRLPAEAARLLRARRRPLVAVRTPGWPARLVTGRALRAALAHGGFHLGDPTPLTVRVDRVDFLAHLRPRHPARRSP